MAKFAVQGRVADNMYASMGTTPDKLGALANTSVALGSGVIAGVASAIISHPADTLLSKVNKVLMLPSRSPLIWVIICFCAFCGRFAAFNEGRCGWRWHHCPAHDEHHQGTLWTDVT